MVGKGSNGKGTFVWVSYPLKQGLKQSDCSIPDIVESSVWVSYPLKQGLKPLGVNLPVSTPLFVWVSYPLKQGLKPIAFCPLVRTWNGLSQLSIKTRIETQVPTPSTPTSPCLSQLSIKTRIETPCKFPSSHLLLSSLSQLSIKTRIETAPVSNSGDIERLFESAIH